MRIKININTILEENRHLRKKKLSICYIEEIFEYKAQEYRKELNIESKLNCADETSKNNN